jgi:hypothetical protein
LDGLRAVEEGEGGGEEGAEGDAVDDLHGDLEADAGFAWVFERVDEHCGAGDFHCVVLVGSGWVGIEVTAVDGGGF